MEISHQKSLQDTITKPNQLPARAPSSGQIDLISKFKEQERISSYLVDQINKLEEKCQDLSIGIQTQQMILKEQKNKMEGHLRNTGDDVFLEELKMRLFSFEEFQKKEDKNRKEALEKIKRTELQLRELQIQLQKASQSEGLQNLREIIQENIIESQKTDQQDKEKSKVLFTELVRLGQQLEGSQQQIQQLNVNFEQKLQLFDQQIQEKEIELEQQQSLLQNNFSNQFFTKIEERLNTQEQALNNFANALRKENTQVDKLQNVALRLQDDMKVALNQLQSDFLGKLESR